MKISNRILAWLVLPVLIGAFLIYNKYLLLKVPKIGFVLHSLAGGSIPGFIDYSIFRREREWLKSGDLLLSVPGKSGTTWTMYTLHQIRNKGKPADFRDIYEEIPWAEFVHYPGESMQERIDHLNDVSGRHSVRIIKSHAPPPQLPVRDDVKYLVIIRNPYDVVASFREFFANHHKNFAKLWGGFPPGAGEDTLQPDDEWEHMMLRDQGNGKPMAESFILDFVTNWWPYRNQSNVLILHYADRIKDDLKQIERLAKFLNVSLTPEELSRIAEQVSFKETKKVQDKLELRYILEPFKERGLVPKDVFPLRTDLDGAMVNQGPKRKGTEQMTPRLKDGLTALMKQKFPPQIIEWMVNGGRLPVEVDLL